VKILENVKYSVYSSWTYLNDVARADPVSHRHIEDLRQACVFFLSTNSFRTELKRARIQSFSRCMLLLISANCFTVPLSVYRLRYKIQRPLHTFAKFIVLTHAVICQQNNVVNILSSFHPAWFICPLRGFARDFSYGFPSSYSH
jgi:hypothetical protein